jgi:Flp pilus assembly pilin Flp
MNDVIVRTWCRVVAATTREEGQAVTEYAVVLVLLALVVAAMTSTSLGTTIVDKVGSELAKF